MQKLLLPTNWTVRAVSNPDEVPTELQNRDIPAQVPGCVHLDLLRENLIPDPYLDQSERLVQWIGRTDWEFSTSFEISEDALKEERVDLVCEGLDTVATLWINDVEVGRSENMHVERRFEVKQALREGQNDIRIRFDSAVFYARAMQEKLGDLPHASSYRDAEGNCEPFHFIRKNACNFGWDWGPGLITCGVWKPIRLEAWSVARIKSVRPLVKVANEKVAVVDVEVEIESNMNEVDLAWINASLTPAWSGSGRGANGAFASRKSNHANDGFGRTTFEDKATLTFFEKEPELWWPCGYGEQRLYEIQLDLTVSREQPEHRYVDKWTGKIGLREVELDTSPDDVGAAWTLKVNGQEIWCKGANWIPDDVFLPRASEPQRLRERLQQAKDAGMNMMRVWGGGIYETDAFYDICDELGLLVWQDFPFACAAYAEEEPMCSLVEEEARFNVTRLAKHPSLVLWNGCNENIWGYFDWNWQEKTEGRTWGAGYYFEILPQIVQELNPTVPYWPGSPYSGSMDIHPLADQYGNKHMWDTWNEVNFAYFRRYSPRFASEFGHQAPPTFATLARAIPEDQRNPFSPSMLSHQKAPGGNDKLHNRLQEHFELPEDFDDWIYLTQLVQARAMTTACEWFRTRQHCRGALYWQLNDCWPVTSWAAIDGDGRPKPLYYATKQFFRPRLLTIQPDGEHLALWAHNDTDETWNGDVHYQLVRISDGAAVDFLDFGASVEPRTLQKVQALTRLSSFQINRQDHYLCISMGETRAFWFFDIDKHLAYPEPKWTTEIEGQTLRLTAQTLIRDLYINADRFGGTAEFGLVTLLPGETWEVTITGADLSQVDFSGRPIVQCANYYGRKLPN